VRFFALSDLHVDYEENASWVRQLSLTDFTHDVLILAGDISASRSRLAWSLEALARRFDALMFVPGNHDLWVVRDADVSDSIEKFHRVLRIARDCGAWTTPRDFGDISIIPLFSWYDHSLAEPHAELELRWMDYRACRWPGNMSDVDVACYFAGLNRYVSPEAQYVMTFSHFLPRIDVMPDCVPPGRRWYYSVLGSADLDRQLRALGSRLHVYGHSHFNRRTMIDGVTYVNNAFGYPSEVRMAGKTLVCIHEAEQ
jgi:predicted phosphodiesterase